VIYYLWSAAGPKRVTQSIHRQIVERALPFAGFANSRQKIIEVVINNLTASTSAFTARGLIYKFDSKGLLDLSEATEGLFVFPRRSLGRNITDIKPALTRKRLRDERVWMPSRRVIEIIKSDLLASKGKDSRLPILRP
jgi:hypothetical protein